MAHILCDGCRRRVTFADDFRGPLTCPHCRRFVADLSADPTPAAPRLAVPVIPLELPGPPPTALPPATHPPEQLPPVSGEFEHQTPLGGAAVTALLACLLLAAGGGWLAWWSWSAGTSDSRLIALGIGVGVVALGGACRLVWRRGFHIDPTTVTVGRGPFLPLFETAHRVADFSAVVVGREVWRGVQSGLVKEVYYTLHLQGERRAVRLARGGDEKAIQNLAEDVGRFLRLDVIDATTGVPRVRPAETHGLNLRQAVQVSAPPAEPATFPRRPPPSPRLEYELHGDRTVLRFPPTAVGCFAGSLAAAGLAVVLGAGWLWYVAARSGDATTVAVNAGVCALVLGVTPLISLVITAPRHDTVEADRQAIRVTRRTLGIPRRRVVPTDRVKGVRLDGLGSVVVETREGDVRIADHSLTPEEARWVKAVLVRVVTT